MIKKIVCLSLFFSVVNAQHESSLVPHGAVCVIKSDKGALSPKALPDDALGSMFSWGLLSQDKNVRNAVAALITYCVTYTLYQTVKNGSISLWSWWKGDYLSRAQKRQIDCMVAEMVRKQGVGQRVICRGVAHEDGICTCCESAEPRRIRE